MDDRNKLIAVCIALLTIAVAFAPGAAADAALEIDTPEGPSTTSSCLYIYQEVGPLAWEQSCGYHQIYVDGERVFAGHVP